MSRVDATPHPRQWLPVVLTSTYISSDLSQSAQYTFNPPLEAPSCPSPPRPAAETATGGLRRASEGLAVCPVAARCSCVQRHLETANTRRPVNDACCVRWEACHASLDLNPGHPPTAHRHTHADMSLYAGLSNRQQIPPTRFLNNDRLQPHLENRSTSCSAMQATVVCRQPAQGSPTNLPAPASSSSLVDHAASRDG